MFDVRAREGHGRTTDWTHGDSQVQTPALIVPQVPQVPEDLLGDVRLAATPGDAITLVSEGTWFYPQEVTGDLVVPAVCPSPTRDVQVLHVGPKDDAASGDVAVFHDAGGWASNPMRLVPAWIKAVQQATPGKLLWAPALGDPSDYALWAYIGADLFDATPLLLAAYRGVHLSVDGPVPAADMEAMTGETWNTERLVAENLRAARAELALVRHHIAAGTLRALVERRIYAKPGSVEILRRLDREHAFLESAAPIHRQGVVPCMTQESLVMPEVERFRRRIRERYTPPKADILVILPCSAKKPYRISKSHRFFQRALDDTGIRYRIHEVMVTSPLGMVPRELEELYPARSYDVPVTGMWTKDEEQIIREQVEAIVARGNYSHIIAHVDEKTYNVIADVAKAVHTVMGHPTSIPDCERLRDTLRAIRDQGDVPRIDGRTGGRQRKVQDLQALASYQFGPEAAESLCRDAKGRGRSPYFKLDGEEGQLASTNDVRGLLSLTLDGARRVLGLVPEVKIGDFELKKTGSLFAVGVADADASIREGDEVLVTRNGELVGCGQAQMAAAEMVSARRGVAVNLRHLVKKQEVTA